MTITPGQSLTYEQAMALPDGAVVSAIWGNEEGRTNYTVGGNDSSGNPKKFEGSSLEYKECWSDYKWHSVRLESLPELPVWVITCDRCGTTYKNNERHACAASEPSEPIQSEVYRDLEPNVDMIRPTDEFLNTISGLWEATHSGFIGWVYSGNFAKMRRRIEPQAEPAKPERQASEIEKEAVYALLEQRANDVRNSWLKDCNHIDAWNVLSDDCRKFVEAYDYAKSIGALNE